MSLDLVDALKQIEREKGIPMTTLVETMEAALVSAYKKNFGFAGTIRVSLDMERGAWRVFAQKSVVETPASNHSEISLVAAQAIVPTAAVDQLVEVEVTPTDFGRIAAQTAKQVLMQRIREAERESVFDEYRGREGEVVTGEVQRVERRNVFINLGRVEALLPPGEQVGNESYRFGERIKVIILEVRKTTKSPQVVVSRSHPNLIRRLFELEVPEIQEGIIEIKGVAREPGARTKFAVGTKDENVDPVGACVGHRGSRVQAVVNELGDEKIDIVRWNDNPPEYLSNALSPAKVSKVIMNEADKSATVIVPEDQQSLAIGRFGQNVRLAARLTGWRIDIRTQEQYDLAMAPPETASEEESETVPPVDSDLDVQAEIPLEGIGEASEEVVSEEIGTPEFESESDGSAVSEEVAVTVVTESEEEE